MSVDLGHVWQGQWATHVEATGNRAKRQFLPNTCRKLALKPKKKRRLSDPSAVRGHCIFSTINSNNLNIGQTTVADGVCTKSGAIEEREVDMENEERSS